MVVFGTLDGTKNYTSFHERQIINANTSHPTVCSRQDETTHVSFHIAINYNTVHAPLFKNILQSNSI